MFTRASRRAVRTLNTSARQYATQPTNNAAANSTRKALQPGNKSDKASKRPQSTVAVTAANQRPIPSPAFNKDDKAGVQPLQANETELDHSFVGMTGGEIFSEMMLRNGVECICESLGSQGPLLTQHSWVSWRSDPSRIRCHLQVSPLQLYSPET
jgi:hypothetical protein